MIIQAETSKKHDFKESILPYHPYFTFSHKVPIITTGVTTEEMIVKCFITRSSLFVTRRVIYVRKYPITPPIAFVMISAISHVPSENAYCMISSNTLVNTMIRKFEGNFLAPSKYRYAPNGINIKIFINFSRTITGETYEPRNK